MANSSITIDVIFNAINRLTGGFSGISAGIVKMQNQVDRFNAGMWKINQVSELFGRMSDTMGKMGSPGVAFEQGMADMSSITGIVGSELESLGKTARKMGIQSGLGAQGAVSAYQILASQIEADKIGMDGLNNLLSKTITLSQASAGLGMEDAANAIAGTINQFGYAADQADRVMNVLAAGSKIGAAEVPDLAMSFKIAGAAAKSAGLEVEDTAAAIEVLSKNNMKGSEAGTAMRNVLLKMQTELGIDFKVTRLSDALKTLTDRQSDAAFMSKTFGAENMVAAQFLVQNADLVDEYTTRMTGTSIATEQAAIRTNTFAHRMEVLKAKINDAGISFYQSSGGLIQMVQFGGQAAQMLTSMAPLASFAGSGLKGVLSGVGGLMKVGRAMSLLSAAQAAGKATMIPGLIAHYGAAGKVAAAGLWMKNAAVATGNFVLGLFNTQQRQALILSARQALASKAQAIWTFITAQAQTVAGLATSIWSKRMVVAAAIQTGWNKVMMLGKAEFWSGMIPALWGAISATWAWTAALLANPVTWIVLGVVALVAAIALAWKHFDKFRGILVGAWEGIKKFGEIIFGTVIKAIGQLLGGIGKVGKAIGLLFKGQFSEAWQTAKDGFGDIASGAFKSSPIGVVVEAVKRREEVTSAVSKGYDKGKNMDTSNFLNFSGKAASAPGKVSEKAAGSSIQPGIPGMNFLTTPAPVQKQGKVVNMVSYGTEVKTPEFPELLSMNVAPSFDVPSVPGTEGTSKAGKVVDMSFPEMPDISMPGLKNTDPDTFTKGSEAFPAIKKAGKQSEKNEIRQPRQDNGLVKSLPEQQPSAAGSEVSIEINYNPVIQVSADMTARTRDDLMTMLRQNKEELVKMLNEEIRKTQRLNYAV